MAELRDDEVVDRTNLPELEVELGFTKSMGPGTFESLRVDFRRRFHREPGETDEEMEQRGYDHVSNLLVQRVDELDRDLGPRGRESTIHNNRK